ncbi:MAG: chemotaxis protein CheW [Acidobacteriaceae bacterium]|nr:chemotaxis protein CheW [Acidobacteriaceae bacterium]
MKDAQIAVAEEKNTISICSLRVGDALFGIDTRQIREALGKTTPQQVPLAPKYIAGVVPYRGDVLTTVSLRVLLGLEPLAETGCILVLDDKEDNQHFGVLVDGVGKVLTMDLNALEENPRRLDPRSMELFDGAFRMDFGLMVRLNPQRLRPSRLAASGIFATRKQ